MLKLDFIFEEKFCRNHYIGKASSLRELIQYVYSCLFFKKSLHHKLGICTASTLHGLIQYADSDFVFEKSFATIITYEWLLSFMNRFNKPIQMSFPRKT